MKAKVKATKNVGVGWDDPLGKHQEFDRKRHGMMVWSLAGSWGCLGSHPRDGRFLLTKSDDHRFGPDRKTDHILGLGHSNLYYPGDRKSMGDQWKINGTLMASGNQ